MGHIRTRTIPPRRIAAGLLGGLLLATAAVRAAPEAPEPRAVLFLEWGESGRPAGQALTRGFRETLLRESPEPVAVHSLGLELDRLGGPDAEAAIRDYLSRRYRATTLAAVVAVGNQTVRCVLDWKATLWPGVPIAAAMMDLDLASRVDEHPEMTGFTVHLDVDGTLDVALALLPETKRVAVAAGSDSYLAVIERALAARRNQLEVIDLVDLSMAETERRVAALPPDAIVFYGAINRDGAGQAFTAVRALERLAPVRWIDPGHRSGGE